MINIVVTPGDVQDRHVIAPLLAIARERFPSLKSAIADGGYQGKLTADEVQQQAGIPLEIGCHFGFRIHFIFLLAVSFGFAFTCKRFGSLLF